MEQKEFEKLISITSTETITDNSYIALRIDELDTPVGIWDGVKNLKISEITSYTYSYLQLCLCITKKRTSIK